MQIFVSCTFFLRYLCRDIVLHFYGYSCFFLWKSAQKSYLTKSKDVVDHYNMEAHIIRGSLNSRNTNLYVFIILGSSHTVLFNQKILTEKRFILKMNPLDYKLKQKKTNNINIIFKKNIYNFHNPLCLDKNYKLKVINFKSKTNISF